MTRAVVATLLVAAACGGKSAPAPTTADPPGDPAPAPAPAPVVDEPPPPPPADSEGVVLLDAGAEPKVVLRYDVKDKTKRKVDFAMEMGASGKRKLAWTYDVKRDGEAFRITMKITKADPPHKGKSGSWMMSARGKHDAVANEKSAQVLVQATQAEHMLPMFPEVAIGAGARWTTPVALSAGLGVGTVPGWTTWELKSVDGTVVTAEGALEVKGDDIAVRDSTMAIDVKATIVAKIDLTSLVGEATMDMQMRTEAEGKAAVDFASSSTMKLRAPE